MVEFDFSISVKIEV